METDEDAEKDYSSSHRKESEDFVSSLLRLNQNSKEDDCLYLGLCFQGRGIRWCHLHYRFIYLSVCLSVQRNAIMDKMEKTAFKHVQLCFVFLIPVGL